MQWSQAVEEYVQNIKPIEPNQALVQRILPLLDYTSLNETDTNESIAHFFQKERALYTHVAAVCVYPNFVKLAATEFSSTPVKIATVANFPEGEKPLEEVLIAINDALEDGAQEMDVVFPYHRYLAGERQYARTFVESCKAACGDKLLKVILETGALGEPAIIADATYDVLAAGADFVKTSTGKIAEGVTLEAAATMLLVLRHTLPQLKHSAGFKASGGIKNLAQAAEYVELADKILGRDWVKPENFRIGTSKLIDEILKMS